MYWGRKTCNDVTPSYIENSNNDNYIREKRNRKCQWINNKKKVLIFDTSIVHLSSLSFVFFLCTKCVSWTDGHLNVLCPTSKQKKWWIGPIVHRRALTKALQVDHLRWIEAIQIKIRSWDQKVAMITMTKVLRKIA
jgi:hypothetical protein